MSRALIHPLARKRLSLCVPLLSLVLMLGACSSSEDRSGPTAPVTPTTEVIPTLATGEIPVGQLVAQVATAWPQVSTARITSYSGVTGGNLQTATTVTIEATVMTGDRRIVTLSGGTAVDESIYAGGRVFMRGTFVSTNVAPNVPPGTWVNVNPANVPEFTPVGEQLRYLTAPPVPPFQSVSDGMKARGARGIGPVQVDDSGRQCTGFTFSESASEGGVISYELDIDANGLPCRLVQSSNGYSNVTIFAFNVPGLRIMAPDAATPVSATPEG